MLVGMLINRRMSIDMKVPLQMTRRFLKGGAQVAANGPLADDLPVRELSDEALLEQCDLVVVFGGDGTLLRAARGAAKYHTPVFGVNFGRLGFLTGAEIDDCDAAVDALLHGEYQVEERMMLRVMLPDGTYADALNDVSVSRDGEVALLYLDMQIDGERYDSYGADGVLISTPTGSTAYSLSCGGPVISPKLDCVLICPICPHTLRARPVVIGGDEQVSVAVGSRSRRARVDCDGLAVGKLVTGQSVTVKRSPEKARLIRLKTRSFYGLLRDKLAQND